jgi:hypothetical protein
MWASPTRAPILRRWFQGNGTLAPEALRTRKLASGVAGLGWWNGRRLGGGVCPTSSKWTGADLDRPDFNRTAHESVPRLLSLGGFCAADRRREKGVMSDTEPAAAAKASTERKPRRLRGHKKGAVTCCVASSARPGVVASSGEVTLLYSTRVGLSPRERLGTPFRGFASHLGLCVSVL